MLVSRQPWVLASRNAGKLRELRDIFSVRGIDVVDLTDVGIAEDVAAEDVIESFDTFEENALAKARYFASQLPGTCVVADDSGLEVGALDGVPGVRSKRWSADEDFAAGDVDASNNALLLARLAGSSDRRARFVCAAAFSLDRESGVERGIVPGRIVEAPRGGNGFGYDPLFFVDELGMTMAEASLAEKSRVSHRARAFAALLESPHLADVRRLTGLV